MSRLLNTVKIATHAYIGTLLFLSTALVYASADEYYAAFLMDPSEWVDGGAGLYAAHQLSKKPLQLDGVFNRVKQMSTLCPEVLMGTAQISETALCIASSSALLTSKSEVFTFLLGLRCPLPEKDHVCSFGINNEHANNKKTPLHCAAQTGDIKKCEALAAAHMNTNAHSHRLSKGKNRKYSIIDIAAHNGHECVVRLLLKKGAAPKPNVLCKRLSKQTPYSAAIYTLFRKHHECKDSDDALCSPAHMRKRAVMVDDESLWRASDGSPDWKKTGAYSVYCSQIVSDFNACDDSEEKVRVLSRIRNKDILNKILPDPQSANTCVDLHDFGTMLVERALHKNNTILLSHLGGLAWQNAGEERSYWDNAVKMAFYHVAKKYNNAGIKKLISAGFDINARGTDGRTALSFMYSRIQEVHSTQLLVTHGAIFTQEDMHQLLPTARSYLAQEALGHLGAEWMHFATSTYNQLEHAYKLGSIKSYEPLCFSDYFKSTNLTIVRSCNNSEDASFLRACAAALGGWRYTDPLKSIRTIASIDPSFFGYSMWGSTPLHNAVALQRPDMVKALLDLRWQSGERIMRVDPNARAGATEKRPLHLATGNEAITALLLEAGADPCAYDGIPSSSCIERAAVKGHVDSLKLLLEYAKDHVWDGIESLQMRKSLYGLLCMRIPRKKEVVALLKQFGYYNASIFGKWTPQDIAVRAGEREIAALFAPEEWNGELSYQQHSDFLVRNKLSLARDAAGNQLTKEDMKSRLRMLMTCANSDILKAVFPNAQVIHDALDVSRLNLGELLKIAIKNRNITLLTYLNTLCRDSKIMKTLWRGSIVHLLCKYPAKEIDVLVQLAPGIINTQDTAGKTALFHAYGEGNGERIEILQQKGAQLTQEERRELAPLCRARLFESVVKRFNKSLKQALGVSSS